jgi:hypothetical protein
MSQQNKITLQSDINSQIADNTSGNISAADVRDNLINMTDSLLFNSGSQGITGSLTVTEGITGSLQGTATTASYVVTAQTASYVETAQTASFVLTASYVENAQTASYVENAQTASFVELAQTASYVETAQTASYTVNAQQATSVYTLGTDSNVTLYPALVGASFSSYNTLTVDSGAQFSYNPSTNTLTVPNIEGTATTASYVENAQTASFVELAQTASYVETAQTASYTVNAVSASYASTASYIPITETAADVNLTLTLTNGNSLLKDQYNSITYNPANNVLNVVAFTNFTGSITSQDSISSTGGFTGSLQGTASYASTASYVNPLNQEVILTGNITASGDLRLTTAGNAVVRPIIDLTPNGTATYNPNTTTTTAYANYGINVITTATATNYCLRLPQTPVKGKSVTIVNNSGINIVLFPSVAGGSINGVIDGVEIIPSDGKSYTFDCYENPLPGGWSLSTSPATGNTSISTGVINWNYGSSTSSSIAYVNDSIKALGGGTATPNIYNGLNITSQYTAGTISWVWNGVTYYSAFSNITPDTIPGTDVWQSIDSIKIKTNITASLANSFYANFGIGFSRDIYFAGTTSTPWTPQAFFQQQDWLNFSSSVLAPWFNSHPGTKGSWQNGSSGGNSYTTTIGVTPGVFTPSQASQYTSDNIGDPGTLTFTINNIPAYLDSVGLRMIGRSPIGSVYTPLTGLVDVWYSQTFSPVFSAHPGTPLIPNIKFNTTFNVQI